MRLAVIVPVFNEQESVADVVRRVPAALPGVDSVRVFVVNDGSTDGTAVRAKEAGAAVLTHPERRGLAAAFRTGIHAALADSADLVATLDADGQYRPEDLGILLARMKE
ncbi:MAG TPA: glycosyltransferase family 2 protein, partial [Candidatus Peribacteria bacterium]|nr:glycosyltransferase family 2 protein [Candidatus Peribacteria bacterium]